MSFAPPRWELGRLCAQYLASSSLKLEFTVHSTKSKKRSGRRNPLASLREVKRQGWLLIYHADFIQTQSSAHRRAGGNQQRCPFSHETVPQFEQKRCVEGEPEPKQSRCCFRPEVRLC